MITIAIIGILAAVAIPQYGSYTKRAKYLDVIAQATLVRKSVAICITEENVVENCDAGLSGIAQNYTGTGNIASIETLDGEIKVTASQELGGHTYILTPDYNSTTNDLSWLVSGTCRTANVC